jgi:hypothetical protein
LLNLKALIPQEFGVTQVLQDSEIGSFKTKNSNILKNSKSIEDYPSHINIK